MNCVCETRKPNSFSVERITEGKSIQWDGAKYWDKPWNPWIGCEPISPACQNCYAKAIVKRFNMTGVESDGFKPCEKERNTFPPRKGVVFCGNMTDLFGDWLGEREMESHIGCTIGFLGKATYLWLTKRPANMVNAVNHGTIYQKEDPDRDIPFMDCEMGNQWFGFTAEDQQRFDERIEVMNGMQGWANMWVSCEPLLGPIDLDLNGRGKRIGWVVVGCESGPRRRSCDEKWIADIKRQCVDADRPVRLFVKQMDIGAKCVSDILSFPDWAKIRQVPWINGECK